MGDDFPFPSLGIWWNGGSASASGPEQADKANYAPKATRRPSGRQPHTTPISIGRAGFGAESLEIGVVMPG